MFIPKAINIPITEYKYISLLFLFQANKINAIPSQHPIETCVVKSLIFIIKFTEIIDNMKSDYEERVDDYIIRKAEFSKERRAINKQVKELLKEEKTKSN